MSAPGTAPAGSSRRDVVIGVAAVLATVAIWAAWPVVTRYGVTSNLSPAAIGVLRFIPPVVLLAPLWLRIGLIPKEISWKVLLPLVCGGLPFFIGSAAGFRYLPVASGVPMASGSIALLVALFSFLLVRKPVAPARLAGYALIVAAVALSIVHGLMIGGSQVLLGDGLFLISALGWALYTVALPYSGLNSFQSAAWISVWALILLLPFGAMEVVDVLRRGLYADVALQVVQQGILSGILAIVAYGAAVVRIGPVTTATLVALTPLISALVAFLVLGEVPDAAMLLALGLTVAGVILASASRQPAGAARP